MISETNAKCTQVVSLEVKVQATVEHGLGGFIEAEKLKRAGKKPEAAQFQVDIEIDLEEIKVES